VGNAPTQEHLKDRGLAGSLGFVHVARSMQTSSRHEHRHLRYSLRSRTFFKSPVLTLAALLCLALGIGASTAIFSVLNAVVLRPLPYPEPERLVTLQETGAEGADSSFSPAGFLDVRAESRTLEEVAGYRNSQCQPLGYW